MKGVGRGGPPDPDIVIPSASDLLGEPANVDAYLRYARENIDRSRLLFQRGDLRYAVFSANEGLELCVKAYLLHYKAIANPVDAGHFPLPFVIKSMRKSSALFIEENPVEANQMRQTPAILDELDALFNKLADRKTRLALWKKSLGIDPRGDEQKLLDRLGPYATEWSGQRSQTQADSRRKGPGGERAGFMPAEWRPFRALVLALFHQKFEQTGAPPTVSLPESGEIPVAKVLYVGQLVALTELFLHTTAIVNGFVHQQISRYPTQIDGVDSGEVYARHSGGVGRLLRKIYRACETLIPHLDSRLFPPPPPPFPLDVRVAPAQE